MRRRGRSPLGLVRPETITEFVDPIEDRPDVRAHLAPGAIKHSRSTSSWEVALDDDGRACGRFTGQMAANLSGFEQQIGVDADKGVEQPRTQAAHITAG
jgi:hypothetical protein